MTPTYFPRLPNDELIRRPKPLPRWWHDKLEPKPEKDDMSEIRGMTLEQSIVFLLGKHGELCREELLIIINKNSSLITSTLRILFKKKIATFEDKAKSRKWRLLKPGEEQTVVLIEEIRGQLQRRIYNMLLSFSALDKWFTVYEITKMLSVEKASKATSALFALYSLGLVERQPYGEDEGKPHQRTTHPYVYRALSK